MNPPSLERWLTITMLTAFMPITLFACLGASSARVIAFTTTTTTLSSSPMRDRYHLTNWKHVGQIMVPTSTTRLFYSNNSTEFLMSQGSAKVGSKNTPLEVPIIGPLLNTPKPLIVGESMWLNPPTPLQWKTIETCVQAQHLELAAKVGSSEEVVNGNNNNNNNLNNNLNLATIDQAPLVAVLSNGGRDYATIAAIVGIVTEQGPIDTSDAESFRESLACLRSGYYSDSSRVRLLGIGRAKLSDFSNKEIVFGDEDGGNASPSNEDDEEGVNGCGGIGPDPVFIARMKLLMDTCDNRDKGNEYGKKSSPVHALNQLSTLVSRVRFLHDDRQRIVRGLQAAQSRLEMAMEVWQDWDGIGSLYEDRGVDGSNAILIDGRAINAPSKDKFQATLDCFLQDYGNASPSSRPLSPEALRCQALDNFGLGTTSSAYADLPSVARVLMERLQPYYSPARLEAEEFEYEAFSWVALQSLQEYLCPHEIARAVYETTTTCDRLELVYEAMTTHKTELNELAQAKSQELRDCGEECTDLF